jgi:hypothetical protein
MKKALSSSETSVLTIATWYNIPEVAILHSHCPENLKSYIALSGWTLYRRRNVSSEVRTGVLYSRRRHSS